jgi:quinol monooxygenase YgiN
MQRVFFISMRCAPEHRQALLDALVAHGRACVGREPGTLRFDVLEDDADANVLYLYEAYADEAAFRAHADGESHQVAAGLLRSLRDAGKVTTELVVRTHSLFAGPHAD